jgi:assimilatory nitrate reductase catalytic subunit
MHTTPRFLQGVFPFAGEGLEKPILLAPSLSYMVPLGATAQPLYFRGGNSTDELICAVLMRDGTPMRYFPIGAKSATHVALRVVEDLLSDTRVELHIAAPEGLVGTIVVDLGIVEI